uniref:Uncharacterized protein n=1 Tax=Cacopsylla melanoneura TaxID=428564 RepID=A0A8D8ZTC9_9HEMI
MFWLAGVRHLHQMTLPPGQTQWERVPVAYDFVPGANSPSPQTGLQGEGSVSVGYASEQVPQWCSTGISSSWHEGQGQRALRIPLEVETVLGAAFSLWPRLLAGLLPS